jgi:parallel beta-helix repeat protein
MRKKNLILISIVFLFLLNACGLYFVEADTSGIEIANGNIYIKRKPTKTQRPTITQIFTPTQYPTKTNTIIPTAIPTFTLTETNIPSQTDAITLTPTLTLIPTEIIPTITNTPIPTQTGNKKDVYVGESIQSAINTMAQGDILYIHEGVYQQTVNVSISGATILGVPGETVVIDDDYGKVVGYWGALFKVSGANNFIQNIEIKRSNYIGVLLSGVNNTLDHVYSHDNMENGILVQGNYSVVQNSVIAHNAKSNENGVMTRDSWAGGLNAARSPVGVIFKNNVVFNNWGEGISSYEATYTKILDNIAYDNWSTNIYISDTTDVLVDGNFIYNTGILTNGSRRGITMGDEKYKPASTRIVISNNIIYGTRKSLYWWQGYLGTGMNNVLISNNTFVNSIDVDNNIQINCATHIETQFINNIIVQENSLPLILACGTGVTYDYNLWNKTPVLGAKGIHDVIDDPEFLKGENIYSVNWFKLLNTSPAINAGLLIDKIKEDYFDYMRIDLPDIGAIEYH